MCVCVCVGEVTFTAEVSAALCQDCSRANAAAEWDVMQHMVAESNYLKLPGGMCEGGGVTVIFIMQRGCKVSSRGDREKTKKNNKSPSR